ncbi:50S ribosomal protein L23, partial [Candidatus Bipolaricaulota bacterium]|nr:50S ribosomal protein L23 [Candidatus Bipolaricaulota bacterium]
KPRRERMSQLQGRTPRWRKAIVRLAPGDRIEIMRG